MARIRPKKRSGEQVHALDSATVKSPTALLVLVRAVMNQSPKGTVRTSSSESVARLVGVMALRVRWISEQFNEQAAGRIVTAESGGNEVCASGGLA